MEEKAKLAELMAEAEFMQQRHMAENRAEQLRVQEKLAKVKARLLEDPKWILLLDSRRLYISIK